MNENKIYRRGLVKNLNLCALLFFVLMKIKRRIISRFKPKYNYTVNTYRLLNVLNHNLGCVDIEKYSVSIDVNTNDVIDTIRLATGKHKLDSKINWFMDLQDTEDMVAIHRWNFILSCLSDRKYLKDREALVDWASYVINDWVDTFHAELNDPESYTHLPRWESYTVGERIANCIIFHRVTNVQISDKIMHAIVRMGVYLANHLEYHQENFNHIINNARALYLLGVVAENHKFIDLANCILSEELPNLITQDGFLREGSSHYQFLFTRWLLEIHYFASSSSDSQAVNLMKNYLPQLLQRCQFFLVLGSDSNWRMPYFGDISPDYPPKWLIDCHSSRLAAPFLGNESYVKDTNRECSWNNLWETKETPDNSCAISVCDEYYPASGWYKCVYADHIFYCRLPKTPDLVPGHFHNDALHFCLFYKGYPILVDSGRKSYDKTDSIGEHGLSPLAHNTVLIDGVAANPTNPLHYLKKYVDCVNECSQEISTDSCKITLSSSGFSRINKTIGHKRQICIKSSTVEIEDLFYGNGEHSLMLLFHFDENSTLQPLSSNTWLLIANGDKATMTISSAATVESIQHRGDNEYLGWRSHEYGQLIEAPSISVNCRACFPISIKTTLVWEQT